MCLGVDQSLLPWEECERPLRWSLVTVSNLARAVVWAMIRGGGDMLQRQETIQPELGTVGDAAGWMSGDPYRSASGAWA